MADLQHRLRSQDLGFLKIVADLWGLELDAPDARSALPKLTRMLLEPGLVLEVIEGLPAEARKAIDALVENGGWMAWSRFTRNFGSLREVGPGKRDREKPFLDPISATEVLWYRALIGRDFLRRENELLECAYIPDDLLEMMPPVTPTKPQPPGRPASPGETATIRLASDRVLDHTCTLLAALRMGDPERSPALDTWQPPFEVVHALLEGVKLITSSEQPVPEDARPFLEMPRGEALAWLVRGWQSSHLFNELRLVPTVICEGAWQNDPVLAREKVFTFLSEIPEGNWWHLDSFIKAIYEREPEFQRPTGGFDTWLIRDAVTGESLAGIQHWDAVDGALIRYLLTGPMHWLGLMDLAARDEMGEVTAFRLSEHANQLLMGQPIAESPAEDQPIEVFSDGRLVVSTHSARIARYQVSRFCRWLKETDEQYTYHLTPSSLSEAGEQGLKVSHLETLLKRYSEAIPPSLLQALHQWDQKGGQVRIRPAVILLVDNPQILKELRESPSGRFVEEPLGPVAAMITPGTVQKVAAALARLGYLSEIEFTGGDGIDFSAYGEEEGLWFND